MSATDSRSRPPDSPSNLRRSVDADLHTALRRLSLGGATTRLQGAARTPMLPAQRDCLAALAPGTRILHSIAWESAS